MLRVVPVMLVIALMGGCATAPATSVAVPDASPQPTDTETEDVEVVTVPDLIGQPIAAAQARLRDAGLLFAVRLDYGSEGATAGTVLRMTPAAGEVRPVGSTVELVETVLAPPQAARPASPGVPPEPTAPVAAAAAAPSGPTQAPPQQQQNGAASLSGRGSFVVDNTFGGSMQSQTADSCSGFGDGSYQIQVKDGSGSILGLASFGAGDYSLERHDSFNIQSCAFQYVFEVPQVAIYQLVLTANSDGQVIETQTRSLDQLISNGAPSFYVQNNFSVF